MDADPGLSARFPRVAALADGAELVQEFLGSEFQRLETYASNLANETIRERTAESIVDEPQRIAREIDAWKQSYEAPPFSGDDKNLIRLFTFLITKLPAS